MSKNETSISSEQMITLVYDELRRLAAIHLADEKAGQTLQPTALVHEAYLRLSGDAESIYWNSKGHFLGAAAIAIRRILVENARRKLSLKRGGDRQRQQLYDDLPVNLPEPLEDIIALDEALTKLAIEHPEVAELVQRLYFSGMTLPDAAEDLSISPRTASRHWAFGKAWLRREMNGNSDSFENS
ncbi:ECF-type sigma factor [Rubinisphaera sp.]|uniref:ECF-type sigma factor n=1 Tax=Rubinisphaera sp. TaxID=2024857 RepID=UPI000C10F94F|nr:ECF-type sigma factor [Rubinisphaera sp.]MBV09399.1 RNA polymerase subunit sigma [Rubinisphaera sp.]HCS54381.1 RNA polymerase subunit sigma [Planctomycetaceae bacterium]|tara:strand:+ start:498 stop:1052 length:555 start_codon:yes stop_codon:yes gene_type:complete